MDFPNSSALTVVVVSCKYVFGTSAVRLGFGFRAFAAKYTKDRKFLSQKKTKAIDRY